VVFIEAKKILQKKKTLGNAVIDHFCYIDVAAHYDMQFCF